MVKKNVFVYKICEYLFFILFFIIYPLFQKRGTEIFSLSWSSIVITGLLCFWLFITSKQDFQVPVPFRKLPKNSLSIARFSIITLFLLFVNMLFWISISYFINPDFQSAFLFNVKLSNLNQIFCLILQVTSVAFFEEFLFRQFLPLRASSLLKYGVVEKSFLKKHWFCVRILLVEILPILFFALGHSYLGFTGFCNSLIAGLCLRVLYKKAHSVIPGSIVHAIYNLVLMFLYFIR
ncbi:MAG: hypothetical protein BKP49_08685 [Treponema sp. CETP13]|nr:MAG: hypothetical protein BKP49_08685 [Treponema sp. CETP13]